MLKKRLIPVLILRDGAVVQSVQFQHTNIIHWKPLTAVDFFNRWAVDEIVLLDVSRNKGKRQKFYEIVSELSKKCFVPLTVGGWVTSVDEMRELLRLGADKVCINSEGVRRPEFITECANVFGSQCVVVSIDSKRNDSGNEEVYIDRGREATGLRTTEWALSAQEKGAGEIFLNSIDHDGFRGGYNINLLRQVTQSSRVPVIAMGGSFQLGASCGWRDSRGGRCGSCRQHLSLY